MMRLFLGVVLVGWFGLGTLVSAQSTGETFELNVGVSGDNATPTIPTLLSVTPVTFSQIDVAWTAATDNIEVGGYQVYRDAILAGETSQTTFSDTGLSGSTTYTYTVRAFDISRNYSSTSNALSTTTPPAPLPPPEATSSTPSPTRVPLRLEALAIDPQTNQATLEWNTNRFSRFSLRWGRSSSYELGYVTSDIYSKDHRTVITDLEPGTRYEYELVGINQRGDRFVLSQDQFVTAEGPDLIPPANVANLNAQLVGDQVVLSWVNPAVDDFAFVRIVRSHLFYPTDPFDGFLVYQDDGEAVTDRAPFTLADTVYYTVFSYDIAGNVSSGAVIAVNRRTGSISVVDTRPAPDAPGAPDMDRDAFVPITFADLRFIQNGTQLEPSARGEIEIDGGAELTIALPYGRLPEHLKNITVTLTRPDETAFSFLLRVNKAKTMYQATIAPFQFSGPLQVTVSIFNFNTESLQELTGALTSTYAAPNRTRLASYVSVGARGTVLLILMLMVLLVLSLLFFRRRPADSPPVSR